MIEHAARRLTVVLATTLLAMLVVAPSSSGAVQDLSTPGQDASDPQVGVDDSGITHVVWSRSDGSNYIVQHVSIDAGGVVGTVQDLSTAGLDATFHQVAVDDNGTTHVVWQCFDGLAYVVQHVSIDAGGAVGAVQTLSASSPYDQYPKVAVDGSGVTHVVWNQWNGSNIVVQHVSIDAGGVVGAIQDLSAPGQDATEPQLAVEDSGVAHVVWYHWDGSTTILRHVSIDAGGVVGAAQDLSATGQDAFVPRLAVDDSGITHVIWYRSNGSNDIVQHVSIDAGGVAGAVQDLSAAGQDARGPQLAVDGSGVTHVAWFRSDGSNYIAQHVSIDAGGVVGAIQDLSATGQDAIEPRLAVDDNGATHVAWYRSDGSNDIVQHVSIDAGGAVGDVQDLSATGQNAYNPRLAVDDNIVTHVVWQRSDGSNDIVQHTTVVDPPVNSVLPAITGTASVGGSLACSTGTWSGSPTFSYAWTRDGTPIDGATTSTRVVTSGDAGHALACTVTASNAAGSSTATSATTAIPTSTTSAMLRQTTLAGTVLSCGGSPSTPCVVSYNRAPPFTTRSHWRLSPLDGTDLAGRSVQLRFAKRITGEWALRLSPSRTVPAGGVLQTTTRSSSFTPGLWRVSASIAASPTQLATRTAYRYVLVT